MACSHLRGLGYMRCQLTVRIGKPAAQLDEAVRLLRLARHPQGRVAHVGRAVVASVSGRAQGSFNLHLEVPFWIATARISMQGGGLGRGRAGQGVMLRRYPAYIMMSDCNCFI